MAAATTSMVLPVTASATTLTSPSGTAYWGEVHAVSEGYVTIKNKIANIECNWTFKGEVRANDPKVEAEILLTELTVTDCTNGWTPNVVSMGWMQFAHTFGSHNATTRWSGATVEFTHFWGTCKYATSYTDGTLTGSGTTGSTATLDFNGSVYFYSGHFACGGQTQWSGSYSITTPDFFDVDA